VFSESAQASGALEGEGVLAPEAFLGDPVAVALTELGDDGSEELAHLVGGDVEVSAEPGVVVGNPATGGPPHLHEEVVVEAALLPTDRPPQMAGGGDPGIGEQRQIRELRHRGPARQDAGGEPLAVGQR
jgi:hypothetical protein